jgi:NDP-sugar pyrophosphorylase family protein
MDIRRAFIAAGGSGSRMKEYLDSHGVCSKSLIEINKKTIVEYLVEEIYSSFDEIYLSTNKRAGYDRMLDIFQGHEKVKVLFEDTVGGSACYTRDFIEQSFFFMFGHSITTREHIKNLKEVFDGENFPITGYKKYSKSSFSAVEVESGRLKKKYIKGTPILRKNEYVLDQPMILTKEMAGLAFEYGVGDKKKSINAVIRKAPEKKMKVVFTSNPHEIHHDYEVSIIENQIKTMNSVENLI